MRALFLGVMLVGCKAAVVDDTDSADTDPTDTDPDTDPDAWSGFFPPDSPWYTEVYDAAPDAASDEMITALQAMGWGSGNFQLDWSIEVLDGAGAPRVAFETTGDFYEPDCDHVPVPLPEGGNLEGEDGYACTTDGDCHLIVADRTEDRLYEMWRANLEGDTLYGGCLAVWEMDRTYPASGRGDQCTSADAAGYPLAPLLFTADEVAAGEIAHAMRFALPNDAIDDDVFYHPATHATTAGDDGPIPYGARLRLKRDFDLNRIADPDARVIAVALQRYGMFLADGGNIPLMARSDRRTTAKWADLLDDGSHALFGIEPQDFEVVALEGSPIPLTYDCVRN